MKKFKSVVAFGEVLWDLLTDGPVLGGAPLNFINRIRELGHSASMISRVGQDELGIEALENMKSLDLNTRYIQSDPMHPTGKVEVFLDTESNADYHIIENVAYDFIEWEDKLSELADSADFLCFGTLAQRSQQSRHTLERFVRDFNGEHLLCDINLRKDCYSTEIIAQSLEYCTICKMNDDELQVLAGLLQLKGDSAEYFAQDLVDRFRLRYLLVTLGNRGVFALSSDGQKVYEPAPKVEVVDTIGAGDSFTAGFAHSLLNGASLREACRHGSLIGGMVATQKGGTQPLNAADLERFRRDLRYGPEEPSFSKYR